MDLSRPSLKNSRPEHWLDVHFALQTSRAVVDCPPHHQHCVAHSLLPLLLRPSILSLSTKSSLALVWASCCSFSSFFFFSTPRYGLSSHFRCVERGSSHLTALFSRQCPRHPRRCPHRFHLLRQHSTRLYLHQRPPSPPLHLLPQPQHPGAARHDDGQSRQHCRGGRRSMMEVTM